LDSLDEVAGARLIFPDPDDVMHFELDISPLSGMYQGATFKFDVEVEREYPIRPPKVLCKTKVCLPCGWSGYRARNSHRGFG
jgi:ubiquitin-conjugating enzyme E2 M